MNENSIHTRSHLGAILKPCDTVLGYLLSDFNVNDDNYEKLNQDRVPDVILVKKYYGDKSARRRARNWKLQHINEEIAEQDKEAEYVN